MGMIERRTRETRKMAARPTRIVAEVRLGSVLWLLSRKVEKLYVRRPQLLTLCYRAASSASDEELSTQVPRRSEQCSYPYSDSF